MNPTELMEELSAKMEADMLRDADEDFKYWQKEMEMERIRREFKHLNEFSTAEELFLFFVFAVLTVVLGAFSIGALDWVLGFCRAKWPGL